MLKFRVWNSRLKRFKMIPQEYVGGRCAHWCMKTEQDRFCAYLLEDTDTHIFQQFTGIKDKNGKEVYIGDILKVHMGGTLQDGYYVVDDLRRFHEDLDNNNSYMRITSFKIKGNIFETPELLK